MRHTAFAVCRGDADPLSLPHRMPRKGGMATVMVVEDDPVFLARFCRNIGSDPDLELFAAVSDCASARRALAQACPDVLLTDLGLPDGSGIDLIRETSRRHPGVDIMVVSVFGDEEHVLAAIEAGATGYILKDSIPHEFVALVKQLRGGGSPISPIIARQLLKRFKTDGAPATPRQPESAGLSSRESEILSLIAKGFSFGEIARLLDVSPHTVTTHVKKIYQKLAVHSRGEAVYEAGKMGLI
jgi:DNA-binding NarL/FixJ family response regulator